ncbi:MAG: sulfatase, partial [Victivallales bacterium]|nr:sulfatase [Victivallales bacterium]
MRAIMVMFDSLNRRMLSPYGCDWVHTPNFQRLAERSATFDKSFVGSMPCMPARRELHTGRYNFLHRSWGPLEPFDDSAPEILRKGNVYTHLVSDHQHYWEDGGCTYHHRYSTWEIVRGQEGDRWKADLSPDFPIPESDNNKRGKWARQDWINRSHMADEESHCQNRTFNLGLEFIETNRQCDNWFLQIETFDPHEPYYAPQRFRDMYPSDYEGPHWDWPPYSR